MTIDAIIHLVGILAPVVSYTLLNVTGHSDPTASQALLALAGTFGGSYLRGMKS